MVERANKEVNRHVRHGCFDRRIRSNWRQSLPKAQRIINFHFAERTGVSPADFMLSKVLDLDRGIFPALPEVQLYAKGSLSTHMANLLKTQSEINEHRRQIILKGDLAYTSEAETSKYNVFETSSLVLLGPKR